MRDRLPPTPPTSYTSYLLHLLPTTELGQLPTSYLLYLLPATSYLPPSWVNCLPPTYYTSYLPPPTCHRAGSRGGDVSARGGGHTYICIWRSEPLRCEDLQAARVARGGLYTHVQLDSIGARSDARVRVAPSPRVSESRKLGIGDCARGRGSWDVMGAR